MSNDFYIISTNSTIKNVSKFLDYDFYEKELKTSNNELKPHVSNLDTNATYYGKKCIKCTIPTLFIEIEYKDLNKDTYFIDYDICLYEQHPTLKDLEARLSARAGEQLDADRTKRDTTWKENLKREVSKYIKIKPTNIKEIKGITGSLLRAEQSISRGNLASAIKEISSVPAEERGPLDAWLTEAMARQNADIAAKNLLAKTTAALQQKN